MNDPDFVYALEIRIIDLEKKVQQLENLDEDSRSRVSEFPDEITFRIESGEHPLRVLREFRALTQRQLGEVCGLWPNHISAIERGQGFSLRTARRLAQGLNVQPSMLIGYSK